MFGRPYKKRKINQSGAVNAPSLQDYHIVWYLVHPSLPLGINLANTLYSVGNLMSKASDLGMEANNSVVFTSHEAVQERLNDLTRSYTYFVSCVQMMVPTDQLLEISDITYLKYLPQSFQLLKVTIPEAASFNNFMAEQKELNVDNPIYTKLADNLEDILDMLVYGKKTSTPNKQAKKYLDIEHAIDSLVYQFFALETSPRNRLILRCILEKMHVEIPKVQQKLKYTDKKIAMAQLTLSSTLPHPVTEIIRDYVSGIPRLK